MASRRWLNQFHVLRISSVSYPTLRRLSSKNLDLSDWRYSFSVKPGEQLLRANYELPAELVSPTQGIKEFIQPLHDRVCRGPTPLLDASSKLSLQNTVRLLAFLDDLKARSSELVEEHRVMEAVVLLTTWWRILASTQCPATHHPQRQHQQEVCLEWKAERSGDDRLPVICMTLGAILAPLVGPLAAAPNLFVVNALIMRRCTRYGVFCNEPPSALDLWQAVFTHHFMRMVFVQPRTVILAEHYNIDDNIDKATLERAIADGKYMSFVSGNLDF